MSFTDCFFAFDTNIFVFGLGADADHPACAELIERLAEFQIFFPYQVWQETQKLLRAEPMRRLFELFEQARYLEREYFYPPLERIQYWESRGAKKGDAVITASLEIAGVQHLVSENRHFLNQIAGLPFEVLSAQEVLDKL